MSRFAHAASPGAMSTARESLVPRRVAASSVGASSEGERERLLDASAKPREGNRCASTIEGASVRVLSFSLAGLCVALWFRFASTLRTDASDEATSVRVADIPGLGSSLVRKVVSERWAWMA